MLLIDVDAQYNLSSAVLSENQLKQLWNDRKSTYHMFQAAPGGVSWEIRDAVVDDCSNVYGGGKLSVIVSSHELGKMDEDILDCWRRGDPHPPTDLHTILGTQLQTIKEDYRWIIIDCPPSLSIFTSNAILCSDYWIAPLIPEALSLYGVDMILSRIADLKSRAGVTTVGIEFAGSILNRLDVSRRDHQGRAAEVYSAAGSYKPFDTWIGDWEPLYIVSDYHCPKKAYDEGRRGCPEWSSVREKYGGEHSSRSNNGDTPEKATLQAKLGLGPSYLISNVVQRLALEFKRRCL